jgi:hypothetical protein
MWRTGLRALCVSVLVAGCLLVDPGTAHACSCAFGTVAEAAGRADVVLTGSAVAVTDPSGRPVPVGTAGYADRSDHRDHTYRVEVDRVYRGTAGPDLALRTSGTGAACGWEGMAVRRPYVLFLDQQDGGSLVTGLCSGNRPLTPAVTAALEEALGRPSPAPTPAPSPAATSTGEDSPRVSDVRPLWLAAVLAGIGLAAAAYRWRRR